MIQRKQTLFLLLAVVVYVLALFLPIGYLQPKGMGGVSSIYNLGLVDENGAIHIVGICVPMFLLLSVAAVISLVTIFLYKKRKQQIMLCSISMLFTFLWYVDYALIFIVKIPVAEIVGTLDYKFGACLPLISIILVAMARKGVKDDEKLVRAADRIR